MVWNTRRYCECDGAFSGAKSYELFGCHDRYGLVTLVWDKGAVEIYTDLADSKYTDEFGRLFVCDWGTSLFEMNYTMELLVNCMTIHLGCDKEDAEMFVRVLSEYVAR